KGEPPESEWSEHYTPKGGLRDCYETTVTVHRSSDTRIGVTVDKGDDDQAPSWFGTATNARALADALIRGAAAIEAREAAGEPPTVEPPDEPDHGDIDD